MRATLVTRCNCRRDMNIPYPPQRFIIIPLRDDVRSVWFNENEPPSTPFYQTRRFELKRDDGPYGLAEYMEVK